MHLGHLCGICVAKQSKREVAYRKYKGRVVLLDHAVFDKCHDEPDFRDMGSSLATLGVAQAVDFFGCFLGHATDC